MRYLVAYENFKKNILCLLILLEASFANAKREWWRSLIAVALSILAFYLLGFWSCVFVFVTAVFIAFRWSGVLLGAISLCLLTSCPVLLFLGQDGSAERMAILAYFFLLMLIFVQVFSVVLRSVLSQEG